MRILIAGASGAIDRALVRRLRANQHEVFAVPRQNLIRSKNSSISLFPITKRLNTVRDGNEEFPRRVARPLRQQLHI